MAQGERSAVVENWKTDSLTRTGAGGKPLSSPPDCLTLCWSPEPTFL